MNKKKIKKNNKKATIKNNIKLLINKYKSSSKKVKIAITSSFIAFILLLIFIIFYNVNINLKADVTVSPDSKIPDVNLYKCVADKLKVNYNHKFSNAELESITELKCNSSNISRTNGIEYMKNLKYLYLNDNKITSISVVNNTKLIYLYAYDNQIKSLNVHNNNSLKIINLKHNELSSLLLNENVSSIEQLSLEGNKLTELDVSHLPNLKYLYLGYIENGVSHGNNITQLSLVHNPKLVSLNASCNKLTSIDLHANPELQYVTLNNNQLTSVRLYGTTKNVTYLSVYGNQLKSIDLSNLTNLQFLYLGFNGNDGNKYGNNIEELSVVNNPYIKYLNAPNNKISEIRIHNNNNLEYVNLNNNELTSARFDDNVDGLKELRLNNNKLTSIDIKDATALTKLDLYNNQLSSIDLSKNSKLTYLNLAGNNLTSVNLDGNILLEDLILGYDDNGIAYGNKLTELHLAHHHRLVNLLAANNLLESISIHLNEALQKVDLHHNQLTEALIYNDDSTTVNDVKSIKELNLQDNNLRKLNLSDLSALKTVKLNNAFIDEINIQPNEEYDLITLPRSSNLPYSIQSIDNSNVVSQRGTKIVGTNEGKSNVQYKVPGNSDEYITYIVGNPQEDEPSSCTQEQYTITWNWNNNSETSTVNCGESITVPSTIDPELEGYEFLHWSTSTNGNKYNLRAPVTSDISLYAVYTEATTDETVTTKNVVFYDVNKRILLSKDVKYGEKIERPDDPTEPGCTFNYWKLENSDTPFDFDTPITSDINLYPDFTLNDNYKLMEGMTLSYTIVKNLDFGAYETIPGSVFNLEDSYTFEINNLISEKVEIEVFPKESDTDISGDIGKITLKSGENNFQVVLKKGSVTETYNYKVIATFADDNSSSSTTDGTGTSNGTCRGILSSSKYEVNNDSLVVGKVPQTESNETILKNIIADCGTVTVYDDSIVIVYNNQTKTYKINRYWSPQTGIKVIKYGLILGIIFVITLGLILINKKIRKKW